MWFRGSLTFPSDDAKLAALVEYDEVQAEGLAHPEVPLDEIASFEGRTMQVHFDAYGPASLFGEIEATLAFFAAHASAGEIETFFLEPGDVIEAGEGGA